MVGWRANSMRHRRPAEGDDIAPRPVREISIRNCIEVPCSPWPAPLAPSLSAALGAADLLSHGFSYGVDRAIDVRNLCNAVIAAQKLDTQPFMAALAYGVA